MGSTASFWASKARQTRAHLRARVAPMERAALASWVSPAQLEVFDAMHVADRRHGLDVVASLRAAGVRDPEVLLAGLLHDAGKGDTGVGPRIAYTLGRRYGDVITRTAAVVPGWRSALRRLDEHAESSARLARAAGCSERTVDLIRHQDDPVDPDAGRALQIADEAN